MSEPIDPAEVGEHAEDIDVEPVPEPETPDDGVIDPADDYTEGGADDEA